MDSANNGTELVDVNVYARERWPDYEITDDPTDLPVKLPVALLTRYEAVRKEYDAVQEELRKLVDP
jgi:hypothetical protein